MKIIKEQIRTGTYRPGERLPSERSLAEILEVGRSSVREAMTVLESIGILEVRPGEGTFVRDFRDNNSMEIFFDSLSTIWDIAPEEILDLLQVRKLLEPHSAYLAATHRTEEDVEELEEIIDQMKEAALKKEVGEELDFRFHYVIARSTKNTVLLNVLQALSDMMYKGLQQTRWMALSNPRRVEDIINDHTQIKDSIERRDSDGAKKYMLLHLENVESNFRQYLKEE